MVIRIIELNELAMNDVHECRGLIKQLLAEGESVKVLKLIAIGEQRVQELVDCGGSVNAQANVDVAQCKNEPVDEVVGVLEVGAEAGEADVNDLLQCVVDGEEHEEALHCGHDEIQSAHVAQQLARAHRPRVDYASGGRELHDEAHLIEQVHVAVVDGEVDGDHSSELVDPALGQQSVQYVEGGGAVRATQSLHVTTGRKVACGACVGAGVLRVLGPSPSSNEYVIIEIH